MAITPRQDAVVVHHEVESEVLDENSARVAERLAIERVQHGVAGAVGSRARALCRRARAELRRQPPKGR